MGSNRRDVDLHLVGHDDTGKMAATAGRNLDRVKRRLQRFTADTEKSMRKRGFDGANSFVQSFLRGITLGRIGDQAAAKMSPGLSRAGTRLGGVFAAALAGAVLVQAGNLILAGLPLLLGPALVAAPLIFLIKKQLTAAKDQETSLKRLESLRRRLASARSKDAKKQIREDIAGETHRLGELRKQAAALNQLKSKAHNFMETISAPLKPTVLRLMDSAGEKLDKFGPKFRRMIKTLAPGFEKLVNGAMDGIIAFVTALEPALPGITAGMKEWGKQAPKIGKGIGDAIAAILKDPEKVKTAVKNTADLLRGAADSAIDLANALVTISIKYGELATKVDKFEQSTGKENGGPLGGMWNAVKRNGKKIIGYLGPLPDRVRAKMRPMEAKASAVARRTFNGVIGWFKKLPGRAAAAVSNLWGRMAGAFNRAKQRGIQRAREAKDGVFRFLKGIPGAAGRAVAGLWGAMAGAFQTALDGVQRFAARIAAAVSRIVGLKAKASGNPGGGGGGSTSWAAGGNWSPTLAPAGAYRTAAPSVNVAAPNVEAQFFLDGRQVAGRFKAIIKDENRRDAYRARIGSR